MYSLALIIFVVYEKKAFEHFPIGSNVNLCPIGIKNRNLVKDIPMIIHLQFGFSQFISFREEDLWNFSQSEHIIGPGSHIEYPTGTKNSNFEEDHPRNIPAKFGSNRPSGFGEEAWNVKSLQTTDDGRQVELKMEFNAIGSGNWEWINFNRQLDNHKVIFSWQTLGQTRFIN